MDLKKKKLAVKYMLITIIIFILILGLLIFVHEFGHFIIAKKLGVRVEEFGFGYPPRIFGKKVKGTIYSLNWIPFGGFVKIYGEDGDGKKDKKSFVSRKIWQRTLMIIAGVTMNFLLAAMLLGLGHGLGLPSPAEENYSSNAKIGQSRIQILQVATKSPAENSGILAGDVILEMRHINGSCGCQGQIQTLTPKNVSEVQDFISQHKGQEIILKIMRGKEILEIQTMPRENPPNDEGAMGVALSATVMVSYPWYTALFYGFKTAFNLTIAIVMAIADLLWRLLSGAGSQAAAGIAGPVGVYVLTGQMVKLGFVYLLQFTALLSLNLMIVNILPFPALDGGRLLFLLVEKINGKPISAKVERLVHSIGFVLLIILMLAITVRDIIKWF